MTNLSEIARHHERIMIEAFFGILSRIRDGVTLTEISRLLAAGDIDGIIYLLQLNRATWEPLEHALREAYRTGGITGAAQVGSIPVAAGTVVARFDIRSPTAERWLATESSRLITEVVDDQVQMVRERLTASLARGQNPRAAALDLIGRVDTNGVRRGGFVGMTSRQAQWVASAREELENLNPNYLDRALRDKRFDRTVASAIRTGKPISQKQIDAAITSMQNRTLKYRGDVIARTESINALRAGQHEAVMQAVDLGEVDVQDTTKRWDATGDARTRPEHAAADGQTVPIDQPFTIGGFRMMYPGDPAGGAANVIQCRCREVVRINFAGKLKRVEGFR